jgi:hypothetical protein
MKESGGKTAALQGKTGFFGVRELAPALGLGPAIRLGEMAAVRTDGMFP